jgi:hypothetical protein
MSLVHELQAPITGGCKSIEPLVSIDVSKQPSSVILSKLPGRFLSFECGHDISLTIGFSTVLMQVSSISVQGCIEGVPETEKT